MRFGYEEPEPEHEPEEPVAEEAAKTEQAAEANKEK